MKQPKPSRTVLVVDDEEAVRDSLSELLSGVGYRVVAAEDAAAAMRAVDREQPDLVLTDIYMESGDGYELIAALRQRSRRVPVVAMSAGRLGYDTLKAALHLGADAVIDKPFPGAGLVETIDRQFATGQFVSI
ncbi:MAG TPA: response regulator [Dongiaceae bacterium]|jgi:CheY-like chemotaxis protein|nr:response regulator [Dongiaceae bacterium]